MFMTTIIALVIISALFGVMFADKIKEGLSLLFWGICFGLRWVWEKIKNVRM